MNEENSSIFKINDDGNIQTTNLEYDENFENDEELINDNEISDKGVNFKTPLELQTYEQLKLFMTNSKNFFTNDLIESVAQILVSKHLMESEDILKIVSDIVISFGNVYEKINSIEDKFGSILKINNFSKILIDSIRLISTKLITEEQPLSTYLFKSIIKEVCNKPEYYAILNIDRELIKGFTDLYNSNIELTIEYVSKIKNIIDSKEKILDVIESVQRFTKFISRDSVNFNNYDEFLTNFYSILNETSTNISKAVEEESEGINLNTVLDKSFYKTIIRTRDDHIKCGISVFDSITNGGFERDRVYLLAAKTGGGKSTLLLNIAYGMYKIGNGMFLPEIPILEKMIENESNIQLFEEYCKRNISNLIESDNVSHSNEKDYGKKKHLIMYFTFENTEYETMKRFIGRMGLFTNLFWNMIERDPDIRKCVNSEKGFIFTENNLPPNMDLDLRKRLIAISSYIRILSKYSRTEFKVIWKAPYSTNAFDIFSEIKRSERNGYIIDAVFVDYPDKMKAINYDNTEAKGEQSWNILGKIIDNLKGIAKQAHVPIIGVSQVTRESNKMAINKNTLVRGGNTAGSQQKESNTDTLITMNIGSKEDNELKARVDLFKNYQRVLNNSRQGLVNEIFDRTKLTNDGSYNYNHIKDILLQSDRSTDILQISFNMPDIQTINNYIVKNRDGISDISFETYIVYGIYLVCDYGEEALESAEFAMNTYSKIVEYMYNNGLLNQSVIQVSNGMKKYFHQKQTEFKNMLNITIKSGNINNFNPSNQNFSQRVLPEFGL